MWDAIVRKDAPDLRSERAVCRRSIIASFAAADFPPAIRSTCYKFGCLEYALSDFDFSQNVVFNVQRDRFHQIRGDAVANAVNVIDWTPSESKI